MAKIMGAPPALMRMDGEVRAITREQFAGRLRSTVARLHRYGSAGGKERVETRAELERLLTQVKTFYTVEGVSMALRDDGRKALLLVHKMLKGSLSKTDLGTGLFLKEVGHDIYMAERMELHALQKGLKDGTCPEGEESAWHSYGRGIFEHTFDERNAPLAAALLKTMIEPQPAIGGAGKRRKKAKPAPAPGDMEKLVPPKVAPQGEAAQRHRRASGPGMAPAPKKGFADLKQAWAGTPVGGAREAKVAGPPRSHARQVNADAVRLHLMFSSLTPSEQQALMRKICKGIAEFALDSAAQEKPGEAMAMALELEQLSHGTVGFFRQLDKESRHLMKESLALLSKSTSAALSREAKFALQQMTPTLVRPGLTAAVAGELLQGEPPGTFVVGSNAYPGVEYTVFVTALEGVQHFEVEESAAQNGGVVYQYRGGERYSNLLTMVTRELKGKAGLKEHGANPRAQVPPGDQRAYAALPEVGGAVAGAAAAPVPVIGKGKKFGKKQVGGGRVSHIRSERGTEYVVSNTQAQGGFGKFRFAVDRDGKRWAVKEFRSEFARHKDNPKTYVTNMSAIKDEIEIMQKVGASVTVKEAMNINGKVYAVMPIMSGEVGDIPKKLGGADRQCVSRSVLRQMADDLGQCHRRGYVHRDVKLPNALWNPEGKVAVSDFGLAEKAPKGRKRLRGVAGTPGYIGPEAYNGQGVDARIDTWSLALTVAEFHVEWWDSPFVAPRHARGRDWESKNFREFEDWRKALITPNGLDTSLIKKGWFGGGSKWDNYFAKLLKADPVLCEYMLTHMLVADPAGRASMEEVSQFMNTVQPAASPDEARAKKAFKRLAGDTRRTDAVFNILEAER